MLTPGGVEEGPLGVGKARESYPGRARDTLAICIQAEVLLPQKNWDGPGVSGSLSFPS